MGSKTVIGEALGRILADADADADALNFSIESDGNIAFDAPQGFRVRVNFIEIGAGIVERVHAMEPYYEGSVASMSDLLLLRAVTVVDRGGDGDIWDFQWLLSKVTVKSVELPRICDEELEYLSKAVELCLGSYGWLVVAAILGNNNVDAWRGLLSL